MSEELAAWILGSVPEPIGGVAVTIERLISSKQVPIAGLIDPYYAARKQQLPITHYYPRTRGLIAKLYILTKIALVKSSPLFVNGSRPQSILIVASFLFGRTAPTILLLHHGDLQSTLPKLSVIRLAIRRALKRYDAIFCLSEKQRLFYTSQGIHGDKLILVDSYVKPSYAITTPELSSSAQFAIDWVQSSDACVIICSGYAEEIYRHDWLLLASRKSSIIRSARLIVCCYGPETAYLDVLEREIALMPNARLFFNLSPAEFDAVLGDADIYSRPTRVDSFGIATYDANAKGLIVVASDVCERPSGTILHEANDFDSYVDLLEQAYVMWSTKSKQKVQPSDQRRTRVSLGTALKNFIGA
jgi:hypothetical protein